jgi:hypothetical protein
LDRKSMLKSVLCLAGMYFKKAKTRATGCSYPKTLNMNPSLVVKVSPSSGIQLSMFVLMHRDRLDYSVRKTYCTKGAMFKAGIQQS